MCNLFGLYIHETDPYRFQKYLEISQQATDGWLVYPMLNFLTVWKVESHIPNQSLKIPKISHFEKVHNLEQNNTYKIIKNITLRRLKGHPE